MTGRGGLPALVAALAACAAPAPPGRHQLAGTTMGTTWAIEVIAPSRAVAGLPGAVDQALAMVDRALSTWRSDSEVARFNARTSTAWIPVSPAAQRVIAAALAVSRLSGGAFDPTVAPLVDAWGFGPAGRTSLPPSPAALRAARARVGFTRLETRPDPPAVRKRQGDVALDLSALGKGFAVDEVGRRLQGLGIDRYLVEIGGELRARGRNARGRPWTVALERPDGEAGSAATVVRLDDAAIATSGDYRNHVVVGGVRRPHVLDPRTGAPITHGLASVSVVAASAMRADALATALLVLGPEAGLRLARRERLAAHFVVRDGRDLRTLRTPAFERYVTP